MNCQEHPSQGGRPRDPGVERRILEVTLRLLQEQGFARMSVDTVAEAAAVSKPTIYRRWTGKADLATAALELLRVSEPAHPGAEGIERLRVVLQNFRKSLLRPNGLSLIGTVLAEEQHTPELLALFRKRVVEPRRAMISAALAEAQRIGELEVAADLEVLVNLLVGSFYARYLSGEPIGPRWVDRIIDAVVPVRRTLQL